MNGLWAGMIRLSVQNLCICVNLGVVIWTIDGKPSMSAMSITSVFLFNVLGPSKSFTDHKSMKGRTFLIKLYSE